MEKTSLIWALYGTPASSAFDCALCILYSHVQWWWKKEIADQKYTSTRYRERERERDRILVILSKKNDVKKLPFLDRIGWFYQIHWFPCTRVFKMTFTTTPFPQNPPSLSLSLSLSHSVSVLSATPWRFFRTRWWKNWVSGEKAQ